MLGNEANTRLKPEGKEEVVNAYDTLNCSRVHCWVMVAGSQQATENATAAAKTLAPKVY